MVVALLTMSRKLKSTAERSSIDAIRVAHLRRKMAAAAARIALNNTPASIDSDASPVSESDESSPHSSYLLSRNDVLSRIPPGALAFFTVANTAYADLAVNWALLLRGVLAPMGAAEHYFIGALDRNLSHTLLEHRLPTMRVGLSGAHDGADEAPSSNFRLVFSKFRAYGVTKADLLLWLLREGRDVVVSDVDCAWLAPPHPLLESLADADLMAGVSPLRNPHTIRLSCQSASCLAPTARACPSHARRYGLSSRRLRQRPIGTPCSAAKVCHHRAQSVLTCSATHEPTPTPTSPPTATPTAMATATATPCPPRHVCARTCHHFRCGHHAGSHWAAWYNTGVLIFRRTVHAISFAERWRDAMAAVHGDGSWGNQVMSCPDGPPSPSPDALWVSRLISGRSQADLMRAVGSPRL